MAQRGAKRIIDPLFRAMPLRNPVGILRFL
jgi:hypothetical protein